MSFDRSYRGGRRGGSRYKGEDGQYNAPWATNLTRTDDWEDRRRDVTESPEEKIKNAIIRMGEVVSIPALAELAARFV